MNLGLENLTPKTTPVTMEALFASYCSAESFFAESDRMFAYGDQLNVAFENLTSLYKVAKKFTSTEAVAVLNALTKDDFHGNISCETIGETARAIWEKIKAFFKKIWEWIKMAASKVWGFIKSAAAKIKEWFMKAVALIKKGTYKTVEVTTRLMVWPLMKIYELNERFLAPQTEQEIKQELENAGSQSTASESATAKSELASAVDEFLSAEPKKVVIKDMASAQAIKTAVEKNIKALGDLQKSIETTYKKYDNYLKTAQDKNAIAAARTAQAGLSGMASQAKRVEAAILREIAKVAAALK